MTAQANNPSLSATKRLHYLDHLRVALTLLVIAHHASQAYAPLSGAWPISNPTKSSILDPFQAVNAAFFMGLFFLIAGYFVPGAYDRKGVGVFLKTRFVRLGIPALFFAVFLFGPMEYFGMPERLSLGEFIRHLYQTGWQNVYIHLWFLLHLLVYSLGYALWRLATQQFNLQARSDGKNSWHLVLLVFVILFVTVTRVVRFQYDINQWEPLFYLIPAEIAHLPQYIGMFLLGILAYRFKALERLPTYVGLVWLGIGVAVTVWFYSNFNFMLSKSISGTGMGPLTWSVWEALTCVGLGIGLLTLFRGWINKPAGRLMAALTRSQYGAYIIHIVVVIGIQAGLDGFSAGPFVKFLIVTIVAAILSFGISHLALKVPVIKKVI